jgi:hypothetical protein
MNENKLKRSIKSQTSPFETILQNYQALQRGRKGYSNETSKKFTPQSVVLVLPVSGFLTSAPFICHSDTHSPQAQQLDWMPPFQTSRMFL